VPVLVCQEYIYEYVYMIINYISNKTSIAKNTSYFPCSLIILLNAIKLSDKKVLRLLPLHFMYLYIASFTFKFYAIMFHLSLISFKFIFVRYFCRVAIQWYEPDLHSPSKILNGNSEDGIKLSKFFVSSKIDEIFCF